MRTMRFYCFGCCHLFESLFKFSDYVFVCRLWMFRLFRLNEILIILHCAVLNLFWLRVALCVPKLRLLLHNRVAILGLGLRLWLRLNFHSVPERQLIVDCFEYAV